MGLFEILFGVALLAILAATALLGGRVHIEKRHRDKYHEGIEQEYFKDISADMHKHVSKYPWRLYDEN